MLDAKDIKTFIKQKIYLGLLIYSTIVIGGSLFLYHFNSLTELSHVRLLQLNDLIFSIDKNLIYMKTSEEQVETRGLIGKIEKMKTDFSDLSYFFEASKKVDHLNKLLVAFKESPTYRTNLEIRKFYYNSLSSDLLKVQSNLQKDFEKNIFYQNQFIFLFLIIFFVSIIMAIPNMLMPIFDKVSSFLKKYKELEEDIVTTQGIAKIGVFEIHESDMNVWLSLQTKELFEVDPNLQVGKDQFFRYFNKEKVERLQEKVELILKEGGSLEYQIDIVTGNDRLVWLQITAEQRVENGEKRIEGTIQDITEKVEAEKRFNILFNQSRTAFVLYDDLGMIDCNEKAYQLLGFENKNEMLHSHPVTFSPISQPSGESSFELESRLYTELKEKRSQDFMWVFRRIDGTEFRCRVKRELLIKSDRTMILASWDLVEGGSVPFDKYLGMKKAYKKIREDFFKFRSNYIMNIGNFFQAAFTRYPELRKSYSEFEKNEIGKQARFLKGKDLVSYISVTSEVKTQLEGWNEKVLFEDFSDKETEDIVFLEVSSLRFLLEKIRPYIKRDGGIKFLTEEVEGYIQKIYFSIDINKKVPVNKLKILLKDSFEKGALCFECLDGRLMVSLIAQKLAEDVKFESNLLSVRTDRVKGIFLSKVKGELEKYTQRVPGLNDYFSIYEVDNEERLFEELIRGNGGAVFLSETLTEEIKKETARTISIKTNSKYLTVDLRRDFKTFSGDFVLRAPLHKREIEMLVYHIGDGKTNEKFYIRSIVENKVEKYFSSVLTREDSEVFLKEDFARYFSRLLRELKDEYSKKNKFGYNAKLTEIYDTLEIMDLEYFLEKIIFVKELIFADFKVPLATHLQSLIMELEFFEKLLSKNSSSKMVA